jgi:hypothetical protein
MEGATTRFRDYLGAGTGHLRRLVGDETWLISGCPLSVLLYLYYCAMVVGAIRDMDTPSLSYPNQECLFGKKNNLKDDFSVGTGEYDHSFPWNYGSAKTWNMHKHLMEEMP